jgi:hypothetical protein
MQFFCKIKTNHNKLLLINKWLTEKAYKWLMKNESINETELNVYILMCNSYTNSGNLKKVMNYYIFNTQNINEDAFEIRLINSDKNLVKVLKEFFIKYELPGIYSKTIFENINVVRYVPREIYKLMIQSDNNELGEKKTPALNCLYCKKNFKKKFNLDRHQFKCKLNSNTLILKVSDLKTKLHDNDELKKQNDKIINILENNQQSILTPTNQLNIANITNNGSNNINIIVNNNTVTKIDKLNFYFANTIDIDTFIDNYQNDPKYKLTFEESQILLENTEANGYISFTKDLFYYLKCKYRQQYEDLNNNKIDKNDVFVLPFLNYDVNCRNHYEKTPDDWKIINSDKNIRKIISISKDHIFDHHNKLVYICGKDIKSAVNDLLRQSDYKINVSDMENKNTKNLEN